MFLLYAAIKSNVGLLGKSPSINTGIIPLKKKSRLKHEIVKYGWRGGGVGGGVIPDR